MNFLSKRTGKLIATLTLVAIISSSLPVAYSGASTVSVVEMLNQSDVASLYKKAHHATVAVRDLPANTDKTTVQGKINEARQAIGKLKPFPGQKLNIQTLSPIVDKRQHPIFKDIVDAINVAKVDPTQAKVDKGRSLMPANLPTHYKACYSSALDEVQKRLMNGTHMMIAQATMLNSMEHIDRATSRLKEIKASPYTKGLASWITATGQKIKEAYDQILANPNTDGQKPPTGTKPPEITPPPVTPPPTVKPPEEEWDMTNEASRKEFIKQTNRLLGKYINDFREENGLNRLPVSQFLSQEIAYQKAKHQVDHDYFSHHYKYPELIQAGVRPNGSGGYSSGNLFGYRINKYYTELDGINRLVRNNNDGKKIAGLNFNENITGHGNSANITPEIAAKAAVERWKDSPAHRNNLLYKDVLNIDGRTELMLLGFYVDETGHGNFTLNIGTISKNAMTDMEDPKYSRGYPEAVYNKVMISEVL